MKTRSLFFWQIAAGIGLLAWFVVLYLISSIPGPDVPKVDVANFDKVVHAGYFFGGALFLSILLCDRMRPWKLVLGVFIFAAVIGALDEYHQLYTPGRSGGDVGDWLADCSGGILGAVVFVCWYGRKRS